MSYGSKLIGLSKIAGLPIMAYLVTKFVISIEHEHPHPQRYTDVVQCYTD